MATAWDALAALQHGDPPQLPPDWVSLAKVEP